MLVDELNGVGALSDCGRDAFDGSVAQVAGGEYTRDASFQQQPRAIDRRWCIVRAPGEIVTCKHEAVLVACDRSTEPFRTRLGTNENEQSVGDNIDRARFRLTQRQVLKLTSPMRSYHLRSEADINDVVPVDLGDEVARHGMRERLTPDYHGDVCCVLGEVDGRLTRRVSPANHVHLTARHCGRFARCGAVEHAGAEKIIDARCL